EMVERFILASPEFLQTKGNGTRDGFIDAAFQTEFGRTPEAPTRDNLRLAMSYPNVTRDVVATGLILSNEYKAVRIRELFTKLLGRTAEDNAVVHFARLFSSGATDELVISLIAGSAEYLSKLPS